MLKVMNQEYYDSVVKFAQDAGLMAELQKELDFLSGFGGDPDKVECRLFKDFAPQSFYFELMKGEKLWLNGGLIFYAQGDSGVGLPQLSVRLDNSTVGWQIHT